MRIHIRILPGENPAEFSILQGYLGPGQQECRAAVSCWPRDNLPDKSLDIAVTRTATNIRCRKLIFSHICKTLQKFSSGRLGVLGGGGGGGNWRRDEGRGVWWYMAAGHVVNHHYNGGISTFYKVCKI